MSEDDPLFKTRIRSSFLVEGFTCLSRPLPVADFLLIDAFGMGVVDALDDLALQPFLDMSPGWLQTRNAIDDVNRQIEAVHLIEDRKLERSIDVALFLVSADVKVVMIFSAVTKLVDERSIRVEVEDNRFVCGEQRIEIAIREAMRVFASPA